MRIAFGIGAFCASASIAGAAFIVDAGDQVAFENAVMQPLEIRISNDNPADRVGGATIILGIRDPGGGPAPEITGFDVTTGTIFDGVAVTVTDVDDLVGGGVDGFPNDENASVALSVTGADIEVGVDELLATFFIDTTGFSAGQVFDLEVNSLFGPTEIVSAGAIPTVFPTTLNDGIVTLIAVPEPALVSLIGLGGLPLLRRRR
ncbi:MAG: hypothetical protein AAGD32_00195 [Planctomycetota bacterium]